MKAQIMAPHERSKHRTSSRFIYYLSALTLLSMLGCKGKSTELSTSVGTEQSILDKIVLKELNGDVINLNKLKGKIIFINFWATWCGPCIKEMPSIENAKKLLKNDQIDFLIASNESIEEIQNFANKRKLDLHFVQLKNLEALGIPALPTTYIINRAGDLVFSETGYREWNQPANIKLLTKIINSHE